MTPPTIRAALVVLALVACKDEERPPMPEVAQAFPTLPLPPQATLVSRSGGSDALQLRLMSPIKARDIESYYRGILTRNGWRVVNDMRDGDGATLLLAERNKRPLWVRIKSTDDSAATLIELSGAVLPDSAKTAKPAS